MMKNIEHENGIDGLLLRCLEGTASEDEYDRAGQWAAQSPENKAYYRKMLDVLTASNLLKPIDAEVQKRVWEKLEREIQPAPQKPNRFITVFRWAAAAAAILIIAYIARIQILSESPDVRHHAIYTAKGEKPVVELNDGSKVWLNDETGFCYPESFGKNSREVTLSGEAYFEVAKNAGKPFLVKTGELTIEVLGTRFNVRASESERFIKTTLMEGSVKIHKNDPKGESDEIILAPNQQLLFDKQSGKMSLHEVNSQLYTAWKDGQIIFDSDRIEEVFAVIEQNFNVVIILKNENLTGRKFTGRFSMDEKPEKMLGLIRQSIPFDFHIQDDTIYVNP